MISIAEASLGPQCGPEESRFLETGFRALLGLFAVGPEVVSGPRIAEEKGGTFSVAAACCPTPRSVRPWHGFRNGMCWALPGFLRRVLVASAPAHLE